MSEHERRRHRRYPLRLAIKVHRGSEELSADIINASVSGCLLLTQAVMQPGELLEVSIPEMMMPRARLKVLRSEPTPTGNMVATCFEAVMADETSLSQLSDK